MTSLIATGLDEFTNYTFAISAVNQIGEGPFTIQIMKQTLADSKLE